jgi:pimeloyl-ACP methyl ester carboxylesterase
MCSKRVSTIAALALLTAPAQYLMPVAVAEDTGQSGSGESVLESFEFRIPVMKTLGGRQLWGDVQFFHGWRIQQSFLDGHYRLLDGDDVRHATGTLEECRAKLTEIRERDELPAMQGRAVILVHGIIRSSKSFGKMESVLRDAGYHVFGFDYPSTRVEIPASAAYLHRAIDSLEGITEVNFVGHSMGGLVIRSYLKEHRDPRIKRMVMLGVPNQGARMASLLQNNVLYRTLYGPAGQQLIDESNGLIAELPTPDFEFAVISGARGNAQGFNPLVPGDDDGTVSLESTRLPGAADFMTVTAMHSFLMNSPAVITATERFLTTGVLRDTGETQPIPHPRADQEQSAPVSR